jgi:hypothetical protein
MFVIRKDRTTRVDESLRKRSGSDSHPSKRGKHQDSRGLRISIAHSDQALASTCVDFFISGERTALSQAQA